MVRDDNLLHVNLYLKPPQIRVFLSQAPHGKRFPSAEVRLGNVGWKYSMTLQKYDASVGVDGAQELRGMR